MAFGWKQQGLALRQHSSAKSGNYACSQAKVERRQTKTSAFCLSFIVLLDVVKPIQQELLWSPHTWAKSAFWSHTADPDFQVGSRRHQGEGRRDQRGNKWLKPESNSLWHALYLALPILPTTFSFYNQNSVKPCGVVVLIINFID